MISQHRHRSGFHAVAEDNDVVAVEARAWNDEAVIVQKTGRFGDILRPRVLRVPFLV